MLGLLFLFGVGAAAVIVDSISGEDEPEPETFSDENDFVFSDEQEDVLVPGETFSQNYLDQVVVIEGQLNVDTGDGNDQILAGAADDLINAGDGDDIVFGGEGDDVVDLGDGNDRSGFGLEEFETANVSEFGPVEAGDDEIYGRKGHDFISDFLGSNKLYGNEGNDFVSAIDIEFDGSVTPDEIHGGWGQDDLQADQGDTVTTGVGSDRVSVSMFGIDQLDESYDVVEITDFNPQQDVLRLFENDQLLLANAGEADPITVGPSPDSDGTSVFIDGIEVVRLVGSEGLTRSDIFIGMQPTV